MLSPTRYPSQRPFKATIVSQTLFVLIYILAVVLSLCVAVMCAYHLHLVCSGETTVESMDFAEYRKARVSILPTCHIVPRTDIHVAISELV